MTCKHVFSAAFAALLALVWPQSVLVAQEYEALEKYNDTTSGGVNLIDGMPQWRSTDLVVDAGSPVAIPISRRLVLTNRFPIEQAWTISFSKAFLPEFVPYAQCFFCDDTFGHVMTFYWFGKQIVFDREFSIDPWEDHFKSGHSFSQSGNTLTLTMRDGGQVEFEATPTQSSTQSYLGTKYTAPNGDFMIFTYETIDFHSGPDGKRLTKIQNSRGHGVEFTYVNPATSTTTSTSTPDVQKIGLIERIDAIRTHCSAATYQSCNTAQLPSVEYDYTDYGPSVILGQPNSFRMFRLSSFTDPAGIEYAYTYDSTAFGLTKVTQVGPPSTDLISFTWSSDADGDLLSVASTTNAVGNSSNFETGPTAIREYPDGTTIDVRFGGRMILPGNNVERGNTFPTYHALGRNPQPQIITDQLGRTTVQVYDDRGRLVTQTLPDGRKRDIVVDDRSNTLSETITPAVSSTPANLVTSATFPLCTVANQKLCNQPQSTTDANGNVTTFTYDAQHGGVLSTTGPAVGGVQPQTRYSYSSRTAYYLNESGQMVSASQPLWLLTSEEHCRTSAADANGNCAAGASDEVVTTYEYSPASPSGPSNIVLMGAAVTSEGETLRTCFRYDVNGRAISETQPKAGLTSCQ